MDIKIEKILSDIVGDFAKAAAGKSLELGSDAYKKAQVILETCFSKYLSRAYERHSKIKTLLYRDKPVDLISHYVTTNFQIADEEPVEGGSMFAKLETHKRSVIVGTAGSGKSMFMRWLFIELIRNEKGRIPLLIELRLLSDSESSISILDYMNRELSQINDSFDESQLVYALKLGKLTIFLDGFDEIDYKHRETYEKEILEISNKYGDNVLVISSRPDDCFTSWGEFYIYNALPLNKEQAVSLIKKIDYDKTIKDKFVAEVNGGLYERHQDFLSNPLLLTMMLLTYEQLAEIPEKIHIFYEQAFDTLFHKHDALKELYKRKTHTSLPIDDFKRIFSAFCLITFSERKISFSYKEIVEKIGEAIEIENFTVRREDFFNDLVKSVCIIQRDGSFYTFSHRSFQEYFAAVFISTSQSIDTGLVIDELLNNNPGDNSIDLLFELNRELVEQSWLAPHLKEIERLGAGPIAKKDWLAYLSIFWTGFHLYASPLRRYSGKGIKQRKELEPTDFRISFSRGGADELVSAMHFCFEKYVEVYRDANLKTFKRRIARHGSESSAAHHEEMKELEAKRAKDSQVLFRKANIDLTDASTIAEIPFRDIDNDDHWMEETDLVQYCTDTYEAVCLVSDHLDKQNVSKRTALSKILEKNRESRKRQ